MALVVEAFQSLVFRHNRSVNRSKYHYLGDTEEYMIETISKPWIRSFLTPGQVIRNFITQTTPYFNKLYSNYGTEYVDNKGIRKKIISFWDFIQFLTDISKDPNDPWTKSILDNNFLKFSIVFDFYDKDENRKQLIVDNPSEELYYSIFSTIFNNTTVTDIDDRLLIGNETLNQEVIKSHKGYKIRWKDLDNRNWDSVEKYGEKIYPKFVYSDNNSRNYRANWVPYGTEITFDTSDYIRGLTTVAQFYNIPIDQFITNLTDSSGKELKIMF